MNALIRSFVPASLGAAIVAVVSFQLRPGVGPALPQWPGGGEAAWPVTLAEASRSDLRHTVEAVGKVEAEDEVKISAEVAGRIAELPVREGDSVRAGQLLLQLDPAAFEADARSAEARVARLKEAIAVNEADVEKARRDCERNQALYPSGGVSRSELHDSATAYAKEKARLNMTRQELVEAESALAKVREDLRKTTVRSPLTGVVSQLSAKRGEVVLVGTMNNPGTIVLTVSDPNSLVVRARIDESRVALVRPGQRAAVRLPHDDRLELAGVVTHVSPKGSKSATPGGAVGGADATAFEALVRIDSPPPEVRMEMTAGVEILVAERVGLLTIPAQAVLHRRPRDLPPALRAEAAGEPTAGAAERDPLRRYSEVVFVESDGVARYRLVRTGIGDRGRVEVLAGLREGERVVAGPYRTFDRLRDGSPVAELSEDQPGGR